MSEKQVIRYADLSYINSSLKDINSNINTINTEIGVVNFKQNKLESDLQILSDIIKNFIEKDRKDKALQLAESRQGNLKQDLQIKYGYYGEVRRMATGILQAVDSGVVSDKTLKFATEEIMIKAPGYWLAPALIALSSWILNDKKTHQKALSLALKADDYKTTLFFMLIMRRLQRLDASYKWLERYFMLQDPHNLDREFILILEAVTTGVFSPASRQLMTSNVKSWLDQLTQNDEFLDKQKSRWIEFYKALGYFDTAKYPLLKKFATNWDELGLYLKRVKANEDLKIKFEDIFSQTADFSKSTIVQLDEILTLLVTNFDDEELPLQEKVRLNELIIELEGDKNAAQALMNTERDVFNERVDFLQLLTNAAFNPEESGATKATQVLSVSICQPWIVEAYDVFTANYRTNAPQTIEYLIDEVGFTTTDGSNEEELIGKQNTHYKEILNGELKKISFISLGSVLGVLLCIVGLYFFPNFLAILTFLLGGFLIYNKISEYKKLKTDITNRINEQHSKAEAVLRGCLAETVDYKKEYEMEDSKADVVRKFLQSITPEDFSSISRETSRNIIN